MTTTPKFKRGDRFAAEDPRDEGKTVEIRQVPDTASADGWRYRIVTETHPLRPTAVGRATWIDEDTLQRSYRKISR